MSVGNTTGDWREYDYKAVVDEIFRRAGDPDVEPLTLAAAEVLRLFERARNRLRSVISLDLEAKPDRYLESLLGQINGLAPVTLATAVKVQLPRGQLMSRDTAAVGQGVRSAPHQDVFGRI